MESGFEIVDIHADNLDQRGFFCYMSKRKTEGYRQKHDWLEARFAEGLKLKILHEHDGRDVAFIEYIPAEYAWRAVHAPGYLVIHCLWVVGKGKGKGYATRLIQECIQDAREQGKRGVVMVSSNQTWLAGKQVFIHNGFVEVDQAPPSFQLLVYDFALRQAPLRQDQGTGEEPAFPKDWDARAERFGEGLTIIRTPQCPYIHNGVEAMVETARARGIPARVEEFTSARQLQAESPSPYGVFGVVYNGRLWSYRFMGPKDFEARLRESSEEI
jgi:GNAT superfamily N-acetyltransferase